MKADCVLALHGNQGGVIHPADVQHVADDIRPLAQPQVHRHLGATRG